MLEDGEKVIEVQLNSLTNSYLIECSEIVLEYAIKLETLTDTILLAHWGLIHPETLIPKELFNNLKETRYVINNKQLPVPLELDQFTNLIDVNDINIFYNNHCLIYVVEISLIEQLYIICNSVTNQAEREGHLCI